MAEQPEANHSSIEETQALKETIDEGEPPRDPKLSSHTMLNTVEINKIPTDGDTHESIVSEEGPVSAEKRGGTRERQRSQLDSQKSYQELVNGETAEGGANSTGARPAIQIPSVSHAGDSNHPSNPGT